MKGHGKAAAIGVVSLLGTTLVAKVAVVCPDLISQWPTILTGTVLAVIATYVQSPMQDAKDEAEGK